MPRKQRSRAPLLALAALAIAILGASCRTRAIFPDGGDFPPDPQPMPVPVPPTRPDPRPSPLPVPRTLDAPVPR